MPAMEERQVPENVEPLLVTNMRGAFLQGRRGSQGVARYGFFHCPPSEEHLVLERLYSTVLTLALSASWANVFGSISEALEAMRASLVSPKTVVLPADHELSEGETVSFQGLQVVVGPFPQGCALVASSPAALGVYTRVGDHLGLQVYNVPRTLMVVRPNGSLG